MNNDSNMASKGKSESKTFLLAIGLQTVGGLTLCGALALVLVPLFDGKAPYMTAAGIVAAIGLVLMGVGCWKYMMLKMRQSQRIADMCR